MNRLWVRLSLASALITVAAVVVAGALAQRQVSDRFRAYAGAHAFASMLGPSGATAVDALAAHYAAAGGWAGVGPLLNDLQLGAGPGRGRGGRAAVLADASGRIVSGADGAEGGRLSEAERHAALPIQAEGRTVGLLLVSSPGWMALSASGQAFLDDLLAALVRAGVLAALLAGLLGIAVARSLAAPLARLSEAARGVSRGERSQRVPAGGPTEIADVAVAFNEMADGLSRSEELRRQMVADIAHELRTPLSVVQGNLRAMLDDVYPLEKSEIAIVYDATRRLERLVDDLRELAHAEAGQLRLHPRPTDLGPLVRRVVDMAGELGRERGVKVTSVGGAPPEAMADPDRVVQVLSNLLANAVRHAPDGSEVVVTLETNGGTVRVSVRDGGPGMTAEEQEHAFDRFWRADAARTRDRGGSGLGLAIARHLIEAQGGAIGVESAPGRGSCFWFALPIAEA